MPWEPSGQIFVDAPQQAASRGLNHSRTGCARTTAPCRFYQYSISCPHGRRSPVSIHQYTLSIPSIHCSIANQERLTAKITCTFSTLDATQRSSSRATEYDSDGEESDELFSSRPELKSPLSKHKPNTQGTQISSSAVPSCSVILALTVFNFHSTEIFNLETTLTSEAHCI